MKTHENIMDSWVYLFSKFTHEALLFEALGILLGLFGYAIFYLIRKRKFGIAGKEIPSSVMKIYLSQLMGDAEEIRTQLFGLLGKGEASARFMANFQGDTAAAVNGTGAMLAGAPLASGQLIQDPKLTEKLKELENKLAEQTNALDTVLNEKMKLEEELAGAKSGGNSDAAAGGENKGTGDRSAQLAERLKQLEAQLAEYAIIEDDLANLKRLQKENKELKAQLGTHVGDAAAPAATAAPAKPAETKTPVSAPEPKKEATPEPAVPLAAASPAPEAQVNPPITAEPVAESRQLDSDHPADFETLVNVVEKNLAEAAKSDNVEAAAPAAPDLNLGSAPASETKLDDAIPEKTEEQLQSDFEKMLNS